MPGGSSDSPEMTGLGSPRLDPDRCALDLFTPRASSARSTAESSTERGNTHTHGESEPHFPPNALVHRAAQDLEVRAPPAPRVLTLSQDASHQVPRAPPRALCHL